MPPMRFWDFCYEVPTPALHDVKRAQAVVGQDRRLGEVFLGGRNGSSRHS